MEDPLCSTCHTDNENGTWTGLAALSVPDMDVDNLALIAEDTEVSLAQYIADEMPNGNAGGCVDECASDIAAYMWSYRTPVPTNLITDGDFEASGDLTGWFTWNNVTLSRSTDQAVSGTQSLLISDRPDGGVAAYPLTGSVTVDSTYDVSAQVMVTGTDPATVRIVASVECTDLDTAYNWVANNAAVAPDTWTALTGSFNIPAECGTIENVQVYFEGTAADIDVYVDDISLVLGESAPTE